MVFLMNGAILYFLLWFLLPAKGNSLYGFVGHSALINCTFHPSAAAGNIFMCKGSFRNCKKPLYNGSTFGEIQGRYSLVGDLRFGKCSIKIQNLTFDDEDYYAVGIKIQNYVQKKKPREYLYVYDVPPQPNIKVEPSKLVSGQKGTCHCHSMWGYYSVQLQCFGTGNTSKQNGEDAELELTATPMQDQRTCVCTLTDMFANKIGQRSLMLNVSYGPQNVTVTPKIDLIEGQSMLLNCQVDSNPPSNISWTREGTNMSANSLKYSDNRLQLTMTSVDFHDAGVYTCRAKNTYGEANGTVMITVQVQAKSFLLSVGIPLAVFCVLFILLLFAYIFCFKQHFRPKTSTKELSDKTGSVNIMGHMQNSVSSRQSWQQVDSFTQADDYMDVGSQDVKEEDGIVYTMLVYRDSNLFPSQAKEPAECSVEDTIYAQPVLHTHQECIYANM